MGTINGGTFKWNGYEWIPAYPTPTYYPTGKRSCPTCNATGINPVNTSRVCPKCNGEKYIVAPYYPHIPYHSPYYWCNNTR